jgi:hypothetical protein
VALVVVSPSIVSLQICGLTAEKTKFKDVIKSSFVRGLFEDLYRKNWVTFIKILRGECVKRKKVSQTLKRHKIKTTPIKKKLSLKSAN